MTTTDAVKDQLNRDLCATFKNRGQMRDFFLGPYVGYTDLDAPATFEAIAWAEQEGKLDAMVEALATYRAKS